MALDHSISTVETRQRSECLQGFCRKCFQAIILYPIILSVQKENKNPFKTCKVLKKVKENPRSRKREVLTQVRDSKFPRMLVKGQLKVEHVNRGLQEDMQGGKK